ncbi:conserved hypothetical protein [Chryseobacterium sp. 8AT]|nr:conserved hypothetical protein [Chryseobacterium sp. 8AT]
MMMSREETSNIGEYPVIVHSKILFYLKKSVKVSSAKEKVILESGQICTVSGEYETVGSISTTVFVSEGKLMPEYCGKKVKWILVKNG